MTKISIIPAIAIFAIFSPLTANCEETNAHEHQNARAKELKDKYYEERKAEEQQFIRAMQDEHEEMVEKKIEETEREKEHHIPHKKDSTHRKDVEKAKK